MKPKRELLTEDIQIQIVAAFGTVWQCGKRDGSEYWARVWDWLRTQHPEICEDPTLDYPADTVHGDIVMLNRIWQWQDASYKGPRLWQK